MTAPAPRVDPLARLAWRHGRRLPPAAIDLALRLAPERALAPLRPQIAALALPDDVVAAALRRVRRLDDWSVAWTWAAQRFLGDARRAHTAGRAQDEALARRHAAFAYAVAAWLPADEKELRALRSAAADLFARALPTLSPGVVRVAVPWRTMRLPALLVLPPAGVEPAPLAVLLNGLSTSKEETIGWAEPFLWQGIAVLALDWPGTGESVLRTAPTADCVDLGDGLVALAAEHALDPRRVGLVGLSLGGALAVRIAAADRRIAAVVAVTPPYDARPWLPLLPPPVLAQVRRLAGADADLDALAARFSLAGAVAQRLRSPLLVFGAGRDLLVPPADAVRLAAAAGSVATLIWFGTGGHGLFDRLPEWTAEAASWLASHLVHSSVPGSTRVDHGPARRAAERAPGRA